MHNDIFLGLLGIESDLFISCENTSLVLSQFKLNPSLCYLHPGEHHILATLCSLANSYSVYYNFTSSEKSFLRAPGLYLQAFKHGLLEIMDRYRQVVLELENEQNESQLFPLSHLVHGLDEYFTLFPVIDDIILDIFQSKRAHGCILLDIVAKRTNFGDVRLQFAIQQLYCKLQSILFRQISIWCIHGLICDMHKEFFIYSTISQNVFDDHAHALIGESYGKMCKEGFFSSKSQFEIQKALLPTCISQRLADKILFVGEAVFRFSFSINSKISVENDLLYSFNETGLLSECEKEFNNNLLQMLSQNYFWKQRLEREIDFLKSKVNNGVISLIYKKGNILSQLRLIKDFFLLGSGEFFILFLDTVLEKDSQLNQLKEKDINDIFIQLFNSFQHERSIRFPIQFRLSTESPNLPAKLIPCFHTLINIRSESDVLGKCILSCSIDWPLQVLLDSRVISQYQLIFNYLLKIRRAHVCLLEVWKNYRKKCYNSSSSTKGGSLWSMWEINYQMRFFLDSLQYYVFSDVIEVQYKIFLRKIRDLKDFENLSFMHEEFLDTIIDKLFITSDNILQAILHILEFVERLLRLFQEDSRLVSFQFNLLKTQFNLQCQDFYKNFQENHPNPNLSIFLMRMDYNQFYSKLLNSAESIKDRLEMDSKLS